MLEFKIGDTLTIGKELVEITEERTLDGACAYATGYTTEARDLRFVYFINNATKTTSKEYPDGCYDLTKLGDHLSSNWLVINFNPHGIPILLPKAHAYLVVGNDTAAILKDVTGGNLAFARVPTKPVEGPSNPRPQHQPQMVAHPGRSSIFALPSRNAPQPSETETQTNPKKKKNAPVKWLIEPINEPANTMARGLPEGATLRFKISAADQEIRHSHKNWITPNTLSANKGLCLQMYQPLAELYNKLTYCRPKTTSKHTGPSYFYSTDDLTQKECAILASLLKILCQDYRNHGSQLITKTDAHLQYLNAELLKSRQPEAVAASTVPQTLYHGKRKHDDASPSYVTEPAMPRDSQVLKV